MSEITSFPTRKQAQQVLEVFAGEIGATFDALDKRYHYKRDKQRRTIYIEQHPDGSYWTLQITGTEE